MRAHPPEAELLLEGEEGNGIPSGILAIPNLGLRPSLYLGSWRVLLVNSILSQRATGLGVGGGESTKDILTFTKRTISTRNLEAGASKV